MRKKQETNGSQFLESDSHRRLCWLSFAPKIFGERTCKNPELQRRSDLSHFSGSRVSACRWSNSYQGLTIAAKLLSPQGQYFERWIRKTARSVSADLATDFCVVRSIIRTNIPLTEESHHTTILSMGESTWRILFHGELRRSDFCMSLDRKHWDYYLLYL